MTVQLNLSVHLKLVCTAMANSILSVLSDRNYLNLLMKFWLFFSGRLKLRIHPLDSMTYNYLIISYLRQRLQLRYPIRANTSAVLIVMVHSVFMLLTLLLSALTAHYCQFQQALCLLS
jgi:hypothetical protein